LLAADHEDEEGIDGEQEGVFILAASGDAPGWSADPRRFARCHCSALLRLGEELDPGSFDGTHDLVRGNHELDDGFDAEQVKRRVRPAGQGIACSITDSSLSCEFRRS